MKQVCQGKIYNTETSELLYTNISCLTETEKEDLYITENGDYFIAYGIKNAIAHSGIYPLTDKETVQWLADRRTSGFLCERSSEILAINNLTKLKYEFLRLKKLSYKVEVTAQASMQGRVLDPCVYLSISDALNRIMDKFGRVVFDVGNPSRLKNIFTRLAVLSCAVEGAAQASMLDDVFDPLLYCGISAALNRIMDEFEVFVSEIITINFHFLIMEAPHEQ
ncbi:hypothetical protein [Candidatus Kuenenia sp.]|uniref:hypothetical protein n=1 Tax=Candidatus Kuenenia sp. TaxID=2499824 RepID=UPI0032206F01